MDETSHLTVILDLSPTQWHLSGLPNHPSPLKLSTALAQILVFLNSHIATKHENTLAVIGAFPGKSVMLYSSTATSISEKQTLDPEARADFNSYQAFKTVDAAVMTAVKDELDALDDFVDEEEPTALVGALTKALCHINHITRPSPSLSASAVAPPTPRILILSVSADPAASYIPFMNCIFSAQKLKVTMDVCKLYGSDTVFLQQAAHLTGGSYIYLEKREAFLQYLIMAFLPPPSLRMLLSVPTQDKVDFRAACFCHKNIVDIGYVCSVCLSIFCQPMPVCDTCRTKFPMKTVLRLNSSRSSQPPSNGNSPQLTPTLQPSGNAGASPGSAAYFSNGNGNGHGYHGPGPGHGSPMHMNGTIPAMGYHPGYQTPTGR